MNAVIQNAAISSSSSLLSYTQHVAYSEAVTGSQATFNKGLQQYEYNSFYK